MKKRIITSVLITVIFALVIVTSSFIALVNINAIKDAKETLAIYNFTLLKEGYKKEDLSVYKFKGESVRFTVVNKNGDVLFDNEKRFFVRQAMFDNDAIVVKDIKSHYVELKSLNHQKSLRFYFENYNHLGIWASKHVGGLIAFEPWVGHTDYVGFAGEFKEKEGVVSLEPGDSFECKFVVEINQ